MADRVPFRITPWTLPHPEALAEFAPAKVNWFLEILGKRDDGFHEILTEMETVDWADRLWFAGDPDGAISLSITGDPALVALTGPPEDNIVLRAAGLLASAHPGNTPGARIWLDKRVPAGAGMGGGSSDCVAALRGLNRLWGTGLKRDELIRLAASLGSDTAFFVRGGRALCGGRGEIVTPLPSGQSRSLVVIWPGFPVSTPTVYRSGRIDLTSPRRRWRETIDSPLPMDSSEDLRERIAADVLELPPIPVVGAEQPVAPFNRLEKACIEAFPAVGEAMDLARRLLDAAGLSGVELMLSGSGSAFVALAENAGQAELIAGMLEPAFASGGRVRACRTVPAGWRGGSVE